MPSFKDDLAQEEILAKYLDNVYREKKLEFERIFDLSIQHQGIDLKIIVNANQYLIDEKAQLHYLNSDLPTFTFELSYLKNNVLKKGWLFDVHKKTQYYFLVTGIFLKNGKKNMSSPHDIEKLKITSVNREKLTSHLAKIGLDSNRLSYYDNHFRQNKLYGKNEIAELNKDKEGLIFFTERLVEKPINLQLRLEYLIRTLVAKKFHYV